MVKTRLKKQESVLTAIVMPFAIISRCDTLIIQPTPGRICRA